MAEQDAAPPQTELVPAATGPSQAASGMTATEAQQLVPRSTAPLRLQQAGSLVPSGAELQDALTVCDMMVKAGFMPGHIKNKEQAFAIYLAARDLKISFSSGLANLYPTAAKDKPGVQIGMSAVLMRGLAYERVRGFKIVYDEVTDTFCKARATRAGLGEWQHITVTIEEAAAQGLTTRNPNYRTNPQGMLRADATRELIRLVAPDALVLGGNGYSARELVDHGLDARPIPAEADVIDATEFKEVE